MDHQIVKAGWLQRQSSVLHRWKRSWFMLFRDGTLSYFSAPDSRTAEEAVRMQIECTHIRTGKQVENVPPPTGHHIGCLLSIILRDKTWTLCAESQDDMSAWHMSLEESRLIRAGPQPQVASAAPQPLVAPHAAPPPPYATSAYPQQTVAYGYPGQVMYGSQQPAQMVQTTTPANTTIVVLNQRRPYRHYGCDPFWYW